MLAQTGVSEFEVIWSSSPSPVFILLIGVVVTIAVVAIIRFKKL